MRSGKCWIWLVLIVFFAFDEVRGVDSAIVVPPISQADSKRVMLTCPRLLCHLLS